MALNGRPSLDPRWPYHHRNVDSGFQLCSVEIYSQDSIFRSYDAALNTWDTDSVTLWTGNARIQPVRQSSSTTAGLNDTFMQQVSVHIDFNGNTLAGYDGAMVDIRPGHYLKVDSSPVDSMLENFVYIVKSVMNSSNAWQRSLMCEVDMEADPNA